MKSNDFAAAPQLHEIGAIRESQKLPSLARVAVVFLAAILLFFFTLDFMCLIAYNECRKGAAYDKIL